MTRHIIIGQGVAGVSAIEAIRSVDKSAEILVISNEPNGFYSRPGLAYLLSGELPEKQLSIYTKDDWRRLKIKFTNAKALRFQPKQHRLELDRSTPILYDRLLLATGASAVPLTVAGANLKGVMYLDTFEDTRALIKKAHRTRTAVVVGGGVLALEIVEGLVANGVKVHYFLRGERYWPALLDEFESGVVTTRLEHDGVVMHPNTEIAEIQAKAGSVSGVRTAQGDLIACELVAVAIGIRPRIELAEAAGLEVERGIIVNEHMQTSAPDVYAAGDVGQVLDPQTGLKSLDTLWNPAMEQGRVAGLNMAGRPTVYQRAVAVNVLRMAGIMTTIIGAVGTGREETPVSIMRGSSETWRQLPNTIAVANGGGMNQLRLLIGEKTLTGALLMGEQTLSIPLQEMISRQVEISPIREQLLQPAAPLGQLLMDFWLNLTKGQAYDA